MVGVAILEKNKVMDWLLDLGKSFLNKEKVILISKLLLLLPILIILSAIIARGYPFIGQIVQLCFDLGFAVMCLGLMVAIYKQNCKFPIIGYYVIVTFIKGVYLFFITSQPTQHGELYTLIFVLSLILHTITGIQLLKTDFSVFGKAFLVYVGGIVLSALLNTSNHELFSALVSTLSLMILIYPFYKELPNYYNE